MEKGFMLGALVGAAAMAAYQMGAKAKDGLEKGKKKVKQKIDDIFD